MEIDESNIISDCNEEWALACLLKMGVVFLNDLKSYGEKYTTCIYVNASDVFAWGCADAECITNSDGEEGSEIIELYKLCKEYKHGAEIWLCKKRNEQPQDPVKKLMQDSGSWIEELNTLPLNHYSTKIKERK